MVNKDTVSKARANLSFIMLTRGIKSQEISIDRIPDEWEDFSEESGRWIRVNLPESENASCCIYEAQEGDVFPNHFHHNIETCYILNKEGKIKVNTPVREEIVSYPNGISLGTEEKHIFRFLTYTRILITWKPAFKVGWEANFVKGKKNGD